MRRGWTTEDEISYVDGLGTHRWLGAHHVVAGQCPQPSQAMHRRLVRQYLRVADERPLETWGEVDPAAVARHCRDILQPS